MVNHARDVLGRPPSTFGDTAAAGRDDGLRVRRGHIRRFLRSSANVAAPMVAIDIPEDALLRCCERLLGSRCRTTRSVYDLSRGGRRTLTSCSFLSLLSLCTVRRPDNLWKITATMRGSTSSIVTCPRRCLSRRAESIGRGSSVPIYRLHRFNDSIRRLQQLVRWQHRRRESLASAGFSRRRRLGATRLSSRQNDAAPQWEIGS